MLLRVSCLGLIALALGGAALSCRPNPIAVPPSGATSATPSAVLASASARPAPVPSASVSVARATPAPDRASFACGAERCASGKETCCALGMAGTSTTCVAAPAAVREEDLKKACYAGCELPPPACEPTYASIGRCDESQDCADNEACCQSTHESLQRAVVLRRCLPLGASGRATCAGGDEVCIAGGPPCRTAGAECVEGLCKKPVKDPHHACDTAADCLTGQHCIHRDGAAECTGSTPRLPCERAEDCRELCCDKRARCTPRPDKIDQAEKWPVQKVCECP